MPGRYASLRADSMSCRMSSFTSPSFSYSTGTNPARLTVQFLRDRRNVRKDDQGARSNLHIGVVGSPECPAFGVNDPRLKPCCSQQLSFPAASLWERSADRKPS